MNYFSRNCRLKKVFKNQCAVNSVEGDTEQDSVEFYVGSLIVLACDVEHSGKSEHSGWFKNFS